MLSDKTSDAEPLALRVLLIEDSIDTLNMLKLWLGTYGCEVLIASNAKEGLKVATRSKPDLIISDIGLPDMDGYELMQKLRKTKGLEVVPAIALSGYGHAEDEDLSFAAGYSAHLTKPTDMRKLISQIRELTTK